MAYTTIPAATSTGGGTNLNAWAALQLTRAQAALPSAGIDTIQVYDFDNSGTLTLFGAVAPTLQTTSTEDGGIIEFGGNGLGQLRPGSSANVRNISDLKTRAWYAPCRIKFVSAPDAGVTLFGWGPTDGSTNSVTVELRGGTSTTALLLRLFKGGGYVGSDATLSVGIGSGITVGTWYDLAISNDGGTTITARLNGTSVATRTDTANFPTGTAAIELDHNAGAGAKKLEADAMAIAFARGP